MRITINDNSELLAGKVIDINHVFCLRERINSKTGIVAHETEEAYLFHLRKDGEIVEQWVPKKVCRILEIKTQSLDRWG